MRHPAKFNSSFLPLISELCLGRARVLDPFGGTGKLREAIPHAICLDIEMEWASQSGLRADALKLPFQSGTFDAVVTSPTYGNRMADKIQGRVTYTAYKGKPLHPNNSGGLQWGQAYRDFHTSAWRECARVLQSEAILVLNIKDHIRQTQRVRVTDWHINTLIGLGFQVDARVEIPVRGAATHLANGDARVGFETLLRFLWAR